MKKLIFKYFKHILILIQLLLVFNILMFPTPYSDTQVFAVIFILLVINSQIYSTYLLSKIPKASYEDLMQNLQDAEEAFNDIEDAANETVDVLVKQEKIPKLLN